MQLKVLVVEPWSLIKKKAYWINLSSTDKRNSTGNLYFTDTMQDPLVGISNTLQQKASGNGRLAGSQPVSRNDSSCTSLTSMESSMGSDMAMSVSKELRTAAGQLQKINILLIRTKKYTLLLLF